MKQKQFYILLLVCSLGMLSSANQNSSDCKKTAGITLTEKCCAAKNAESEGKVDTKMTAQPLNLLLFEL